MAAGNVLPIIGIVAARLLAGAGRGMYEQSQQDKQQQAILSRQVGADGLKTAINQGNWEAVEAYTSDPKSGIDKNLGGMLSMLAKAQRGQMDASGQRTQQNTVQAGEGEGATPGAMAASTMGQAPQPQADQFAGIQSAEQLAGHAAYQGMSPDQRATAFNRMSAQGRFTDTGPAQPSSPRDVQMGQVQSWMGTPRGRSTMYEANAAAERGADPMATIEREAPPAFTASTNGPQAPPVSEGTAQAGPAQAQTPRGLSSINVAQPGDFRAERKFKDPQTGAMVEEKPPKPEDLFRRLLQGAAAKGISYEPDELFDEVVRRGWINDIKGETLTRIGQLGYNRAVQRELTGMGAKRIEELDPNERQLVFERAWRASGVITEAGLKEVYRDPGQLNEKKLELWAGLRKAQPNQSFSQARAELRARGIVLPREDELRFGQEEFGRVRNGIMAAWNRANPTAPITSEQAGTLAVDTWFGGDRRFASDSERTRMDEKLELDPTKPAGQMTARGQRPPRAGDVTPNLSSVVGAQQAATAAGAAKVESESAGRQRGEMSVPARTPASSQEDARREALFNTKWTRIEQMEQALTKKQTGGMFGLRGRISTGQMAANDPTVQEFANVVAEYDALKSQYAAILTGMQVPQHEIQLFLGNFPDPRRDSDVQLVANKKATKNHLADLIEARASVEKAQRQLPSSSGTPQGGSSAPAAKPKPLPKVD